MEEATFSLMYISEVERNEKILMPYLDFWGTSSWTWEFVSLKSYIMIEPLTNPA